MERRKAGPLSLAQKREPAYVSGLSDGQSRTAEVGVPNIDRTETPELGLPASTIWPFPR